MVIMCKLKELLNENKPESGVDHNPSIFLENYKDILLTFPEFKNVKEINIIPSPNFRTYSDTGDLVDYLNKPPSLFPRNIINETIEDHIIGDVLNLMK